MTCCQALPVCYVPGTPIVCGNLQQSAINPPILQNGLLVQNTSGFTITGSPAQIIDGNLSSPSGSFKVNSGGGIDNFQNTVHVSFDLSAAATLLGFAYWNGWGGIQTDGDGMGDILVDLFNPALLPVATGLALPNVNNGARHDLLFGPFANVKSILLRMGAKPFAGSADANVREIAPIFRYESMLTWTCNGLNVIGRIEEAGGAALTQIANPGGGISVLKGGTITVSGGNLTQTDGPHTITFDAGGNNFVGNIVTNQPGNFSSLVVSNASPTVTVTGNATQTFDINWTITPASLMSKRLARLTDGVLYDVATGVAVVNPVIVDC